MRDARIERPHRQFSGIFQRHIWSHGEQISHEYKQKPVKSAVRQSARVKKEEACEASLEGFSGALAFGSDSSVCDDGEGWFFGCIMMGLLHVDSALGNLDSGPDKATSGL